MAATDISPGSKLPGGGTGLQAHRREGHRRSSFGTVDVAIVGAGTAGAAAAALCAQRGMRVVLLERRPLDQAGARWVNGVPEESFDRAGFPRPTGPERRGDGRCFHLIAGFGPRRLVLRNTAVLEVDMRLLVARLQLRAAELGAVLVENAIVEGFDGTTLRTSQGDVKARWFVDASGLAGARLLNQPAVPREDVCAAGQQVRRITDPAAAAEFCERHGGSVGETLCFSGIEGGYSILNIRVEGSELTILTGSLPAFGFRSGHKIIEDFCAEQSHWIGEKVFGGARAIPLRRAYDRIAGGRVALLGDAACQVFTAHGSGIGAGMEAARLLAETLVRGGTPSDYEHRWQRTHGGRFAAYDLFRRFSQTLTVPDLERLMGEGIMDAPSARAALRQEMPVPDPRALPGKLRALAGQPALARRLGSLIARMAAVSALYRAYPRSSRALAPWSRAVDRVYGIGG